MHLASQAVAPPANPGTDYDTLLSFNNTTAFQGNWQGDSANYSALPGYGLSASQKQADYNRVATSGVKTVSTWFDTAWAYAAYPAGSADWNSALMLEFWDYLAGMKARGVNVLIKMGWHFPQNIAASSGAAPATPSPANETTFAAWVSDGLHQAINGRGYTNVVGIQLFTEPSTNQLGNIPGGYAQPYEYYAHIATVVRDKIVADDATRTPIRPRIQIVGPNENSFTTDDWTLYMKAFVPTVFDSYAAHSYCLTPGFAPLGLVASTCAPYQTWIDRFSGWVGGVTPSPLIADEGGVIASGDSDPTGYRGTADWGWQWVRQIDGHMQGGCSSSLIWLLSDQPILGDVATGPVLRYGATGYIKEGTTVKPSWYAISLHANLTGGGGGTRLYRLNSGDTSTLHGTAAWIPQGVKNATNAAGEWSVVIINESTALDVQVNLSASIGGRTVYRYVYSGEIPPTSATDPAYLLSWDQRYAGVTSTIRTSRIPGHSVVIYSTINLNSPASTNLALTAQASSDSNGFGVANNVNRGNPSNVIGATNSWRKADNASHFVQLAWAAAVTLSRLELAFVATTPGVVYADYTTTGTPAPLADYTIEYWNGSTWVQLVSVTGNALPNRSHTFAPVTTTAIRLNATSAAATAAVNNIGAY